MLTIAGGIILGVIGLLLLVVVAAVLIENLEMIGAVIGFVLLTGLVVVVVWFVVATVRTMTRRDWMHWGVWLVFMLPFVSLPLYLHLRHRRDESNSPGPHP